MKPNKPAPRALTPLQGTGRPLPDWDLWEPTPPTKTPNRTPRDIPRQRSAVPTHTHPRAHTPTVARAGTTPPPPPRRPKKLSKLSARLLPRLQPSGAPHLPSLAAFRPTRPRWGEGRPGRDGGRWGTRRVPAGSDTRLTARGWKAPRDLTSDPLSSHRARRTLPHRREAETNFVQSVASYAHPWGRARRARGLRSAHAPEGAVPRHLLPAPTHLRNATWPGPGAERWDQGSGSQLQGRKWPAPPFRECFRSAYCVLLNGGGGTTERKGCQSP